LTTTLIKSWKEVRNRLKKKGINATFSDAIRWLYENAKDESAKND